MNRLPFLANTLLLVILSGEPPLILGFFSPADVTIGVWFTALVIIFYSTVPVANITIGLPVDDLGDGHDRSLVRVAVGHVCPLALTGNNSYLSPHLWLVLRDQHSCLDSHGPIAFSFV